MKRAVIVALCVVSVAVVGILSVQAYNRYRHERNAQTAQAALQAAKQTKSKSQQQATFNAQANSLQALCRKDLAAYQALPAAQKAKQQAPNCSLQFVQ